MPAVTCTVQTRTPVVRVSARARDAKRTELRPPVYGAYHPPAPPGGRAHTPPFAPWRPGPDSRVRAGRRRRRAHKPAIAIATLVRLYCVRTRAHHAYAACQTPIDHRTEDAPRTFESTCIVHVSYTIDFETPSRNASSMGLLARHENPTTLVDRITGPFHSCHHGSASRGPRQPCSPRIAAARSGRWRRRNGRQRQASRSAGQPGRCKYRSACDK